MMMMMMMMMMSSQIPSLWNWIPNIEWQGCHTLSRRRPLAFVAFERIEGMMALKAWLLFGWNQ
jgi:hypothetical protein